MSPAARRGAQTAELAVEALGAQGDGIARHDGALVFVPYALPGERIRAALVPGEGGALRAERPIILTPSEDRQAPLCKPYGRCGGCTLQHLPDEAYAALKTAQVTEALRRQGLDTPVAPLLRLPARNRRRAVLAARRPRQGAGAVLGFHERGTHRVVDLTDCAVLAAPLWDAVAPLRALFARILPAGGAGGATLLAAEDGLDVVLRLPRWPELEALEDLADFAAALDIARLSVAAPGAEVSPVAARRPVRLSFGGVAVDVPPGAFVQASAEAEAHLAGAAASEVPEGRRVLDLYAGLGTFTFPLARHARVHAVEGDAQALAALQAAARRAGLADRLSGAVRDLMAAPLAGGELDGFDLALFDPPRAGARAQAAELAGSAIPRVIAASCNPASFARDARLLVAGGYRLLKVQPVDQFVWSSHVELFAAFAR